MTIETPTDRDRRRMQFGWYMYDWANSAFAVTILAALFGPYLDTVVVPKEGYLLFGWWKLSATSLYGYALGLSALLVLVSSPVLGAIADLGKTRKRFLVAFCLTGSLSTALMYFVGPGDVGLSLVLFLVANFCFVSGNVFYDSFLPHISEPADQDRVSGTGYTYGYIGGGLLFVLQLLLVQFHDAFGIADAGRAVRISLASVGFWWAGFATVTFVRLREPGIAIAAPRAGTLIRTGFSRVFHTAAKVRSMRQLLIFLFAFMIYNDGIQTAISMATIYGSDELRFDALTLMGCLLMVQAVGAVGSQVFSRIAKVLGTRNAVLLSLVVWSGVVIYAFFMTKPVEFWILGGIVGLVLGGSQALSRSLYSRIIPAAASAEFFGFFSVFEKFSAIGGPIVFAVIRQVSGSSRYSIVSLIAFFIVGFVILLLMDMRKAEAEAAGLEAALARADG